MLGLSMKDATVGKWLISEGGQVKEGEPLLELTTEKISAIIESPTSGILGRVFASEGRVLLVGGLLCLVGDPGDDFAAARGGDGTPATDAPIGSATTPSAGQIAASSASPGESLISPAARRVARELGIDVKMVLPSAQGRRITAADVEAFAASTKAAGVVPSATEHAPEEQPRTLPFKGVRRAIAERLSSSLQQMAQVTISREAEVSGLVARRDSLKAEIEAATGLHLTYTDVLAHEVAPLLLEHPLLNCALENDQIVLQRKVHLGIAVALDEGLIVPVVRDAHAKSLVDITRDRAELALRAKAGTLSLDEIEGGTFTISNLGSFGVDAFTPIVNPPQCAILGLGRIVAKPVAVNGHVEVQPLMWLSLTFDHRLVDGASAARFLHALAERLR
jgi:pyruvate dehydrogenase E2 component (dihydrolipoamide acetyltransferase)